MIRKYQESDLESVLNIWYEASTLAHPFLKTSFVEKVKKGMRNIYIPNSATWIFEEKEKVVGFISMMDNEIGGLFVRPNYHGKGIGAALVNFMSELHPLLEVEVFKQNQIGKPFYEKYGFTLLKEYYEEASEQMVLRMQYKK